MKSLRLVLALGTSAILLASCATTASAPAVDEDTNKSGASLTVAQQAYDVQHYTLDIGIFPKTKRIEGAVSMRFRALSDMAYAEMDLDPRMKVSGASSDGQALNVRREKNKIFVDFNAPVKAGTERTITVDYGGKPHIGLAPPWEGGLVWSTSLDGKPWIATAVQGQGCDLWWPCKDHYADKPDDGLDMKINVPESVKVAANGVLVSESPVENGRHTFHWRTQHPTTGYAVAINVGPYARLEDSYQGINGTTIPIEFWVLPENEEKARKLIKSDVKPHMAFFEKLLGPYPWGDEKVGFVETPHLGMEHQTINAYGDAFKKGNHGFDWLMHHELAHEWFGNVMTHTAASDAWLHEGYASHMQAEYARRTVGSMAYGDSLYSSYRGSEHCTPVVNPSETNVGAVLDVGDIYTKGSWLIHTLRGYIGDEAFWAGTRELIFGSATPWNMQYPIKPRYRSTEDFITIMTRQGGKDVRWIVDAYLKEADIPTLETSRDGRRLNLSWSVPGDRSFPMPVTVSVDGRDRVVSMSGGTGSLDIPENADVIIDPDMKVFRRLPIIGSCEDRTKSDTARIKARRDRMAKQYRWQRN